MASTMRAIFFLDFRGSEIHLWSGSYNAPSVPICGQPLLERLAAACLKSGVTEILVCANALDDDGLEALCSRFDAKACSLSGDGFIETLLRYDNDTLLIWGTPLFDSSILAKIKPSCGLRGTAWRPESPTGVYHLTCHDLRRLLLENNIAISDDPPHIFEALARGLSRAKIAPLVSEKGAKEELLDIRDGVDVSVAEFRCDDENLLHRLETSVGGYWRKPIAEHILLCNTRFPPKAFYQRLMDRVEGALTCYPSQQVDIVSLVAAMTAQPSAFLAVGNGVTDLIHALYATLNPTIAIPTPTFAGFQTPLEQERKKSFVLAPPHFDLDVQAFLGFVLATEADTAVVVNPNNPTGRLVDFADIVWLIKALESHGRRLIVDESFIDFPSDGRASSAESLVPCHDNLIVVKSLGKVFGLGGIRLGYLMSSDTELVAAVRRKLPLWNINGIAEYALFILPEFLKELDNSLKLLRKDREQFIRDLGTIPGLEIVPSQTNFVLCRLPEDSLSAAAFKRRLILRESVLVRECGYQIMKDADRYLRLTVRTPGENKTLVKILRRNLSDCTTTSRRSPAALV
ncbi:pyridoxal phosphate-dependent aminotransferase [Sinorhizobium fredii]|uniref:pyridoxal phosphate-dependent aminotransferase n=1 Tax=Rhizobium fredii TaxID=380 RepID=UPI0004BC889E|nr:histidinol-phosphate transaminase [Sinorhizobium fredii]ASY73781.1 L-threonine 3-O-phosphate decarboxylase [Sinorhizobium fredii CCBAU 83666]